jgi:hypothetical protein
MLRFLCHYEEVYETLAGVGGERIWGLEHLQMSVYANYTIYPKLKGRRDSSVGIATTYGLEGRGIECRWGRDFPHPSRPALGPNQTPIQ